MTTRVRTLIVDDEPVARRTLRRLLERDPDVDVVGECRDGLEAVAAVARDRPDLMFLDVQMPEVNGFEVLRRLDRRSWPVVVFVTAYDQYAVDAFDVHALDYLLKPFDDERFAQALDRAKAAVGERALGSLTARIVALLDRTADGGDRDSGAGRPERPVDRIAIKSAGRVFFLKTDEIDWIEAEDYYVRLHVGRASHLVRRTLRDLGRELDPRRFARIHRSAVVNVDRIKLLEALPGGDSVVVLHDGSRLRVSRGRRQTLRDRFGL